MRELFFLLLIVGAFAQTSGWEGSYVPVNVVSCPPSCCCSTGAVTVKKLSSTLVELAGPVSGGAACYYQDFLMANMTLDSVNEASYSLGGEKLISARLLGTTMTMTPSNDAKCSQPMKRVTAKEMQLTQNDLSAWVGNWETEPNTCVSSTYCCCSSGKMLTTVAQSTAPALTTSSGVMIPSSLNNVDLLSFQIFGHTDGSLSCSNATDITAKFMLFNKTTALSADRGVTSHALLSMVKGVPKLRFSSNYFECAITVVKAPDTPTTATTTTDGTEPTEDDDEEDGEDGEDEDEVDQQTAAPIPTPSTTPVIIPSTPSTPTTATEGPGSDLIDWQPVRKRWVGKYKTTTGCIPGTDCCCSTGSIDIKDSSSPDTVIVSSGLDGGSGCFNKKFIQGPCTLDPAGQIANCAIDEQGVVVNLDLNLSEDNKTISVHNSLQTCKSVAMKTSDISAGLRVSSTLSLTLLVLFFALLL